MVKYLKKFYLPAMLGSAIEYYDIALYGYMAPILIEIFLPDFPKTQSYFYYFLFEFFAALAQIAGARFFGKIGDTKGRKKAMYYALIGTSVITFIISFLPTYHHIGIYATLLFACARLVQSFCLGGEYNGGAIYCLEHEQNPNKHGIISGLYCMVTTAGILAASGVATLISSLGVEYFRIAYGISFFLAFAIYFMRRNMKETPAYLTSNDIEIKTPNYNFFAAIVISLFCSILYGMPTKIFNAILPITSNIATNQIMLINSYMLLLYMIVVVVFGALANRFGVKKMIEITTLAIAIITFPSFILIENKTIISIILAKTIFGILNAAFTAPFHALTLNLFAVHSRYTNISTAYTIGKCFSSLILSSSFLLFDHFHNLNHLAVILSLLALITWRIIKSLNFYPQSL